MRGAEALLELDSADICALSLVCRRTLEALRCDALWMEVAQRLVLSRPPSLECLSWWQSMRYLPFVGAWHESWSDVFCNSNIVVRADAAASSSSSSNSNSAQSPAPSSAAEVSLRVRMGTDEGKPESTWEVSDVSFDGRTLAFRTRGGTSGWSFAYEARRSAAGSAGPAVLRLRVQRLCPDPMVFWGFLLRADYRHASARLAEYDRWKERFDDDRDKW
eukprot:m51a1_g3706 hypothetical protein (218) ;mRNA; f:427556-428380